MHLAVCPVMPAGETMDSRPRRGAVSFCPYTHTYTQAKYHQPYRSGGGVQTCIWDAGLGKLEEDIGRLEPEGW